MRRGFPIQQQPVFSAKQKPGKKAAAEQCVGNEIFAATVQPRIALNKLIVNLRSKFHRLECA